MVWLIICHYMEKFYRVSAHCSMPSDALSDSQTLHLMPHGDFVCVLVVISSAPILHLGHKH